MRFGLFLVGALCAGVMPAAFCVTVVGSPSLELAASRQGSEAQPARTPDIHFTPTRHDIADAMLQLAKVGPADVVYDLGSGDGRIPIIAAQKYGARGIGIEIDPQLVELSWRIANEAEVANRVNFIVGDLFDGRPEPGYRGDHVPVA